MSKRYDRLFRLLFVGDSAVGKTCLLCRFSDDEFPDHHISTIGIDFKLKTIDVDGTSVKAQIWDTAGQERYESITKQYYQKAEGIFLVYDITNEASFKNLDKWLKYIRQFAFEGIQLMLVGNKVDRQQDRVILYQQGKDYADSLDIPFIETSARSDTNIDEAFVILSRILLAKKRQIIKGKKNLEVPSSESPIDLHVDLEINGKSSQNGGESPEKKNGWCCAVM